MLTATRSRPIRRSCRAASRGRAATTPAKDPPILSPITTPIATDGDPGEPPPSSARRRGRRRDVPRRRVRPRRRGCEVSSRPLVSLKSRRPTHLPFLFVNPLLFLFTLLLTFFSFSVCFCFLLLFFASLFPVSPPSSFPATGLEFRAKKGKIFLIILFFLFCL
jgi:hypothetical protein